MLYLKKNAYDSADQQCLECFFTAQLKINLKYCFRFYRSEKAGACLLPNTCLGIAAKLFAQFETQRVGISWKEVSGYPSPDENFNMAFVFLMLLAQCAIYGTVTWWVLRYMSLICNLKSVHIAVGCFVVKWLSA